MERSGVRQLYAHIQQVDTGNALVDNTRQDAEGGREFI